MKNINDVTKKYYVYMLLSIDETPFYVGKGTGKRYNDHFLKHNLKKLSQKNKMIEYIKISTGNWPRVLIVKENMTAREAFTLEEKLIQEYGRKDKNTGVLLNATNGGGRETGWCMPDSVKKKISIANKGKKKNITWGKNISKALKGRTFTDEHKEKIRQKTIDRVVAGRHNFTSKNAKQQALKRIKNGTHHFLQSSFNKKPFKLCCSDGRTWLYNSKVEAVKDGFTASVIDKLRLRGSFIYTKGTLRKTQIQFKAGDMLLYEALPLLA
jgi:uncharacterized protein YlaI